VHVWFKINRLTSKFTGLSVARSKWNRDLMYSLQQSYVFLTSKHSEASSLGSSEILGTATRVRECLQDSTKTRSAICGEK